MDIEKILRQMTLEDKIALCSGENFWETKKYEKYGIPSLFMCDGPHSLRKHCKKVFLDSQANSAFCSAR